jgi:hypothetical protein
MPLVYPHKIINLDDVGASVLLDRQYQWVDVIGTPSSDVDIWLPPAEIPGALTTINVIPQDSAYMVRIRPQAGKYLCGGDFIRYPALGQNSLHSVKAHITVVPQISHENNRPSGHWVYVGGDLVQWGIATTGTHSVAPAAISTLAPFDLNEEYHEAYTDQWDVTNAQYTPPCAGTYSFWINWVCTGFLAGEHFWAAITAPGGVYYEQSYAPIAGIVNNFIMGGTLTLPLTAYGLACFHDGAANRSVQAVVEIQRKTG